MARSGKRNTRSLTVLLYRDEEKLPNGGGRSGVELQQLGKGRRMHSLSGRPLTGMDTMKRAVRVEKKWLDQAVVSTPWRREGGRGGMGRHFLRNISPRGEQKIRSVASEVVNWERAVPETRKTGNAGLLHVFGGRKARSGYVRFRRGVPKRKRGKQEGDG